jgi:hypothetical protein
MRLRIAKVDHNLRTTILGDLAIESPDDAGTRLLIGTDHRIEVIRRQRPGRRRRWDEGTHQDSKLAPFGVGRTTEKSWGGRLSSRRLRESLEYRMSRETILFSCVEPWWRGWGWERRRHALGFRGWRRPFLHRHDEAIPSPVNGLDELLSAPAVPNGLAYGFHRTLECRIADELLWPDLLTQLLLGHNPIAMRQQVSQDLERFAPQPSDVSGVA